MRQQEISSCAARLQLKLNAKELLIVLNIMDKHSMDSQVQAYLGKQLQANRNDIETMIKKLHLSTAKKQNLLQILATGDLTAIATSVNIFARHLEGEKPLLSRVEMEEKKRKVFNWAMDGLESIFPQERHHAMMVLQGF